MLHAESEKRMRFVKAESKLKDYINGTMTYQESIRNKSYRQMKSAKAKKPVLTDPRQNFSIQQQSTLMKKSRKRRPATGSSFKRKRVRNRRMSSGYGRPYTAVKFKSGFK